MAVLDVFGTDAFSMVSLTQAINHIPFKPARIGAMSLFEEKGITTTNVIIEERDGVLALLPTVRRGGPPTPARTGGRTARSFAVPHIPYEDAVLASDVQNIRRFGSENEAEGVAQVVADKLASMRMSHEVTHEYHKVGAIHGLILDADGGTIYNLYTEFAVSEQTVDFVLATSTTDVRAKCLAVLRSIDDSLGMAIYDHIHAICGPTWFDAFIGHDYVRDAYYRWNNSEMLRNDPRKGFPFGGIVFEEYRATIGSTAFVNTSQARFFPVGCPGLFVKNNAPGNFMETANTIGLPLYAKQERMEYDRGVKILTESNPLCLCTRPRACVKGTTS